MTKQEIYEQVVQLTSELHATNVAEKIFSAAKEGDSKKVEEVFELFKKENPDLYAKIVSFGEKINEMLEESETGNDCEIFGVEEDKENGVFVFDTNVFDSLSFFALVCFANVDDSYLFYCYDEVMMHNFAEAFDEAGYEEMGDFVCNLVWKDWVGENDEYPTWYELLVAIFKGEFSEEETE